MIENRMSPKKPLIAAFCAALVGVAYAMGYRGKWRPSVESLSAADTARVFIVVLCATFVCFYILRMLGVQMGLFGGREKGSKVDLTRGDKKA
jgi:hypothetical protein